MIKDLVVLNALLLLPPLLAAEDLSSARPPFESSSESEDTGPAIAATLSSLKAENSILIGPEDLLEIKVKNHPELDVTAKVDSFGEITIPSVGPVVVKDLTKEECQRKLTDVYSEFLEKPRVEVAIKEFNSRVIYVLGSVRAPGKYALTDKVVTIRDAVYMAGLPDQRAAIWRVFVIRQTDNGPAYEHINLYKILIRGHLQHNVVLKPGDVVYVPMGLLDRLATFIGRLLSPIVGVVARVIP